jgi:hypothetical protein
VVSVASGGSEALMTVAIGMGAFEVDGCDCSATPARFFAFDRNRAKFWVEEEGGEWEHTSNRSES